MSRLAIFGSLAFVILIAFYFIKPAETIDTNKPPSAEKIIPPPPVTATPDLKVPLSELGQFAHEHKLSPKLCPGIIERLYLSHRDGKEDPLFTPPGDHLYVYLVPGTSDFVLSGNRVTMQTSDGSIAVVKLDIAAANNLAKRKEVLGICLRIKAVPQNAMANIVSEGVELSFANQLHGIGITGSEQTVVVLDSGFDINNPEIADNLDLEAMRVFDETGDICDGNILCNDDIGHSHGTAVAETVLDMAPGAKIIPFVPTGYVGFENAVRAAIELDGVDVLTSSIAFPHLPPFIGQRPDNGPQLHIGGDQAVAVALSTAVTRGITVTQAAGNAGGVGFRGTYTPAPLEAGDIHQVLTGHESVMDFRPELNSPLRACLPVLFRPQIAMIHQGPNLGSDDYDIFLFDENMSQFTGVKGDYKGQDMGTPPELKILPWEITNHSLASSGLTPSVDTNNDEEPDAYRGCLVMASFNSTEDTVFHIKSTWVDQSRWPEYKPYGSLIHPADAKRILPVGEIHHFNDQRAETSSQGPTDDGRDAPLICGYGGTATSQFDGSPYYNRFFGTSAATPHVAGAAALVGEVFEHMRGFQKAAWLVDHAIALPDVTYAQPNFCGSGRLSVNSLQSVQMIMNEADCNAPPAPGVNWSGCNLWEHHPERRTAFDFDLRNVDLSNATLIGTNFHGVDLSGANLVGANLQGARLRFAKTHATNYNGADLRYADLEGAELEEAIFFNANLSHSALLYANLANAHMQGANLSGAWLHFTSFYGANLTSADLSSVEIFDAIDMHGAIGCSGSPICSQ